MKGLPPRGPVLADLSMLLRFDVDCGELVPGHRFIARGLAGPTALPIPDDWDGDDAQYEVMLALVGAGGGYPGFSLEYELVPGVEPTPDPTAFFRYLVRIDYSADVDLPWPPTDGGAIAPFRGGPTTHGSRGDWPLPPDATALTFTLMPVGVDGFADQEPAGELVVDLATGVAEWRARS